MGYPRPRAAGSTVFEFKLRALTYSFTARLTRQPGVGRDPWPFFDDI